MDSCHRWFSALDDAPSLIQFWDSFLAITDPASRALLATCRPADLLNNHLTLMVPNDFTRDRVDSRLRQVIEEQAGSFFDSPVTLICLVDDSLPMTQTITQPALVVSATVTAGTGSDR